MHAADHAFPMFDWSGTPWDVVHDERRRRIHCWIGRDPRSKVHSSRMSAPDDIRLAIEPKPSEDAPRLLVSDRWTGEEIARVAQADASRAEDATVACVRAFDATRAL